MNPAQLENIELRLLGATHTPWQAYERAVVVAAQKELRKATKAARLRQEEPINTGTIEQPDLFNPDVLEQQTVVLEQGPLADTDTLRFVAHAPDDIQALVTAVRASDTKIERLERDVRDRTAERDEWEQRARAAETRLAAIRETVRRFTELCAGE